MPFAADLAWAALQWGHAEATAHRRQERHQREARLARLEDDVELGKGESLDLLLHLRPNGLLPRSAVEPRLAVGLARLPKGESRVARVPLRLPTDYQLVLMGLAGPRSPDWPARLDHDLGSKILEFRLRGLQ